MPLAPAAVATLAALPWLAGLAVLVWRARDSRRLDDESADPPADAPLVSVIVPARNERHNIERCVRSILASDWPALEVIVVDDHSSDGTGDAARAAAAGDSRIQIVVPPALPDGWFGKQWACATGARAAHGEILVFTDADTWHAPDLITRTVAALRSRAADLVSVGGWQEMESFWEKLLQPQFFVFLSLRFGGTETVNRSHRVSDKIANGQFIAVRRDAYEAMGGHGVVRDKVAEDLALAQRYFAAGRRTILVLGMNQLSTRMYASLGALIRGWSKNAYAGGIDAARGGRLGRLLFPLLLPLPPLFMIVPPLVLLVALLMPAPAGLALWAGLVSGALLLFWLMVYRAVEQPLGYALLFPFGAALTLAILMRAIARGRRVEWKGREYQAA